MAEGAAWKSYDERNPFGKGATVVGGDNIPHSQQRYEAIKAMKAGRATPEQVSLVTRTDEIIQEALALQD